MYKSKYPSLIEFLTDQEDLILLDSEIQNIENLVDKDLPNQLIIDSVSHSFNKEELNFIRQWFNTVIDSHSDKDINKTEWNIALQIHKKLDIRPENRIVKNCA